MSEYSSNTDSTDTAPPSTRRTVLDTLRDYPAGVSDDLLVSVVADAADASAFLARSTIGRLEREGEIYRVNGTWKVTDL